MIRICLFTAALLGALHTSAFAQENGNQCAKLDDGAARLLCYDENFRVKRESLPSKQTDWTVRSSTSRIDDTTNVFMQIESVEPIVGKFGKTGPASITIRCTEGVTSILFSMNDHFLSDNQGHGEITYRIDSKPAQTTSGTESTDHTSLGLWNDRTALPFIRSLFGADNLLVRITPYSESPMTADFRIAGIERAIEPLQTACGWSIVKAVERPAKKPSSGKFAIMIGGQPDVDACPANGVVHGLDPAGDNFLSVRAKPSSSGERLDTIRTGQAVYICGEQNGWFPIIYGDGNCSVSSPIPARQRYEGPCRSGWVSSRFILQTAG